VGVVMIGNGCTVDGRRSCVGDVSIAVVVGLFMG